MILLFVTSVDSLVLVNIRAVVRAMTHIMGAQSIRRTGLVKFGISRGTATIALSATHLATVHVIW